MKRTVGTTPLANLSAVALDLETTSLDVRKARIVQFGAVRLDPSRGGLNSSIEEIVNPNIDIPLQSTEIHGISNEMASGAQELAELWPAFMSFLQGRVLIGHTIAYDLTVLENQARQHGLNWERPRSLCVRLLAPVAVPELQDPSLDRLCAWFGIEIERRHSALSDASAAAHVFLEFIPLLARAGVRTLAEAERLTLQQDRMLQRGTEAGWIFPVVDPSEAALSGATRGYDTYAYRHTLSDVMSKPPTVVPPQTSLLDAVNTMTSREISSVLVAADARAGLPVQQYAILTERDVLRKIAHSGEAALQQTAGSIARQPLRFIREGAFVYRAIARMQRLKIRHLAVVAEDLSVSGMVSARDLLRLRTDAAISLDDEINEAESATELAAAWGTLPAVVSSLISEELDPHTSTRIVSEEIRAMTARAVVLSEKALEEDGHGPAPCAFAVMVLGSGGRGESLLKPDQDNAIIFAEGEAGGPEDKWFQELGIRFADLLDTAGIPLCKGGVMARNAAWRGSADTWRNRLEEWTHRPKPENLLNVDILFDQIPVHGERQLSLDLLQDSFEAGSASVEFAKAMGAKLETLSNPFGLFGRLKSDDNKLDLKLHGLFPLVSAARALAIRHNIAVHSTKARLQALIDRSVGDTALMEQLIGDHAYILSLMLRSQGRQVSAGRKPTNLLNLSDLSRNQRKRLKTALTNIQYTPDLVRDLLF